METPFWHTVGIVAMIAFAASILLAIVARSWFSSSDSEKVKRAANVLSALGGAANARSAQSDMVRRKVK
jgi:type II secretory pathway pseudopilin PulG